MPKIIEAIYENSVFKLVDRVDVKEGEKVKIEIKKEIFGILRDWEINTQKLKDGLKDRGKFSRIIDELVEKLKKFGNKIDFVVLFGSYARGEGKEESDIDVLIIGDVKLDDVIDVVYPIFLKYRVYISPIVMDKKHFEMLRAEGSKFIENVLGEGVVLYGRV